MPDSVAAPSSRSARFGAWARGEHRADPLLKRAALALAYSNVWIALHAGGLAVVALLACGARVGVWPLAVPVCTMFAVYSFDKVARLDPQDEVNDPERTHFVKRWRGPLLVLAAIAFLVAVGAAALDGVLALVLTVTPIAGALLYMIPFLPRGFRYRRLKDITGVKSLTVAGCWGIGAGLAPLAMSDALSLEAAVVGGAWGALRMFINTVYFDMGDLEGDRAEGTVTIPVWCGYHATRRLLQVLNVLSSVLLAWAIWAFALPVACHALHVVTLYGVYFLHAARDEDADLGFLCDVVVDGEFIVAAAALVTASLVSASLATAG